MLKTVRANNCLPIASFGLYCMHFSAGACAGKNDACISLFGGLAETLAVLEFRQHSGSRNSLSMLLLRYEMNTWAARNSSWSVNIIFSEVKCGPWNAKVGWQVAYRDRKTQFEVEICNLPANLSIPRATRDFKNNDVSRSWTVLSSPCIHWGSEEEHRTYFKV